jgi:cobalamin biosynthesis protein CobD/CbiB
MGTGRAEVTPLDIHRALRLLGAATLLVALLLAAVLAVTLA